LALCEKGFYLFSIKCNSVLLGIFFVYGKKRTNKITKKREIFQRSFKKCSSRMKSFAKEEEENIAIL